MTGDLFGEAPEAKADRHAARVAVKVAEMLADLAAIETPRGMFAVIDKHRVARDWMRKARPEVAATVDAAFRKAYDHWMEKAE